MKVIVSLISCVAIAWLAKVIGFLSPKASIMLAHLFTNFLIMWLGVWFYFKLQHKEKIIAVSASKVKVKKHWLSFKSTWCLISLVILLVANFAFAHLHGKSFMIALLSTQSISFLILMAIAIVVAIAQFLKGRMRDKYFV